jgi:hypothetical protein
MHVRPGRKSSGCPVAVCTAVGTIWRASKLGGLNIKEYLQPRKSPREKSYSRNEAGSRPKRLVGKAADTDEETGTRSLWDRRGTGSSISGKIFRITSGRTHWQQGLVATCQDSWHEAKCRRKGEPYGFGA